MKETFELIKERLLDRSNDAEAQIYYLQDKSYLLPCMFNQIDIEEAISKAFFDARDIVSEVEAEYGNGWIPCSERLPEKSGRVLVSYESINDEIAVSETSYDYKRKTFWISPCVIAWMPLPSPYKHTTD